MDQLKFRSGAIALYRVRKDFVPRTPEQLCRIAQAHGVPESIVPPYAGDRDIVGRAIQSVIGPAARNGWLVKKYAAEAGKVVYTIARMEKDATRERIDYEHEDTLRWEKEWNGGVSIEGWHEVARDADKAYQEMRGTVLAADWTSHVIGYLTGEACHGQALKDNGGAYWVPPQGLDALQALRGMLSDVGLSLIVAEIEPDNIRDAQEVAQGGLTDQIAALAKEVNGEDGVGGFDGTQNASVYKNRLQHLRKIREKMVMYDMAIGINKQDIQAAIAQLDVQIRDLYAVRLDTVIHKDGTRESISQRGVMAQVHEIMDLVAQGEDALAQALIDGTLTVDLEGLQDTLRMLDALEEGPEPLETSSPWRTPGPGQAEPEPEAVPETAPADPEDDLTGIDGLDAFLARELATPAAREDIPTTW